MHPIKLHLHHNITATTHLFLMDRDTFQVHLLRSSWFFRWSNLQSSRCHLGLTCAVLSPASLHTNPPLQAFCSKPWFPNRQPTRHVQSPAPASSKENLLSTVTAKNPV